MPSGAGGDGGGEVTAAARAVKDGGFGRKEFIPDKSEKLFINLGREKGVYIGK